MRHLSRRKTVPVPKLRQNGDFRAVDHTGPETGSRSGKDNTKHYYHRAATHADNSDKHLRILPLPLTHFPSGPLILPLTTGKDSSPLCPVRTLYAPCRAQRSRQQPRGSCTPLNGLSRGRRFQRSGGPKTPLPAKATGRRPEGSRSGGIPTSTERARPALRGELNKTPPEASLQPEENGFQVPERARGPPREDKGFPWSWRTSPAEAGLERHAKRKEQS